VSDAAHAGKSWMEIGRSVTTPTDNKNRKEVNIDVYYVVVGFEVNNPVAFKNAIHDLEVDYGHAFFFLVKNGIVEKVFSFGPTATGKVGWFDLGSSTGSSNKFNTGAILKDGFKNARVGTPDYAIQEQVRAFKLMLTAAQGIFLAQQIDKARQDIVSGKNKYTAYINDTCAETARDLLSAAGIRTPSGSGAIKHSGVFNSPIAYAVNPYMWHRNFVNDGYFEITAKLDDSNPAMLLGRGDPLFPAFP
jgi:hypothetical protein